MKSNKLNVSVSDAELNFIKFTAKLSNQTVSRFIRESVINNCTKLMVDSSMSDEDYKKMDGLWKGLGK